MARRDPPFPPLLPLSLQIPNPPLLPRFPLSFLRSSLPGILVNSFTLTSFPPLPHLPADVRSFDMFLDEASGDLFSFHRGLGGWLPFVNCGLTKFNVRPEEVTRSTTAAVFK